MRRRWLLSLFGCGVLRGGAEDEIRDVLALIASALAESNPTAVFGQFDPAWPDLPAFRTHLTALMARAAVLTSIELAGIAEAGSGYSAGLDWIMEIRPHGRGALERRRERVTCTFRQLKGKWRIASLSPVSFFAPPKAR